jgi:integrase/recombinase XerD
VLEKVFRRATVRARIESNPIGSILRDYVEYLVARGHKAGPLHQYVFAVEHFGRWVRKRPIDYAAVDRFIKKHLPRCRCCKPSPRHVACTRAALRRLLEMLDVERTTTEIGATGDLLREFEDHLRQVCGLSPATIFYRLRYARELLRRFDVDDIRQLQEWSTARITAYVSTAGRRCRPSSGQVLASSIRSFLRFLLLRGMIHRDLAAAVPSFANWRLRALPTRIGRDDLERLVAAADPSSRIGMRDRAVLLCMTELGLRGADVAAIETDGIDLAGRVVRFRRPKQREQVELPMTPRLTSALQLYLRQGRPPVARRGCSSSTALPSAVRSSRSASTTSLFAAPPRRG